MSAIRCIWGVVFRVMQQVVWFSLIDIYDPCCSLHPGDLYPFTRKPLFIIVDSDNSSAFQVRELAWYVPYHNCLPHLFLWEDCSILVMVCQPVWKVALLLLHRIMFVLVLLYTALAQLVWSTCGLSTVTRTGPKCIAGWVSSTWVSWDGAWKPQLCNLIVRFLYIYMIASAIWWLDDTMQWWDWLHLGVHPNCFPDQCIGYRVV